MSEAIKNQYQTLAELRRIDEKAHRLQVDIERIPEEVAKLQNALNERRSEYDSAKTEFESCEKKLRSAELDLKDKEDKLHKAEGKMMEVKTNEEYQAAIRENQSQKDAKSGLEDRILTLITDVEEQRRNLKQLEQQFKSYEATFKVEKQKLEEEQSKLEKLYQEQMSKRDAMVTQLDPSTASMYQRLAVAAKGSAVVHAENGMCRGCNMQIRPQLYNEILGFKQIHRCPNCGKILIASPGGAPGESELSAD